MGITAGFSRKSFFICLAIESAPSAQFPSKFEEKFNQLRLIEGGRGWHKLV
jgi:hypothetical protein